MLTKSIPRLSVGLLAGFGAYYLVSASGSILTYLIAVLTPNGLKVLVTTPFHAAISIIAVAIGAAVAGYLSREQGARNGLLIAAIPIVAHMVPFLHSRLSFIMVSRQPGLPSSVKFQDNVSMIITLGSWALMLVIARMAGIYGERQADI